MSSMSLAPQLRPGQPWFGHLKPLPSRAALASFAKEGLALLSSLIFGLLVVALAFWLIFWLWVFPAGQVALRF